MFIEVPLKEDETGLINLDNIVLIKYDSGLKKALLYTSSTERITLSISKEIYDKLYKKIKESM